MKPTAGPGDYNRSTSQAATHTRTTPSAIRKAAIEIRRAAARYCGLTALTEMNNALTSKTSAVASCWRSGIGHRFLRIFAEIADKAKAGMDHQQYPDTYLRDILTAVRTIAVVGASPRRGRPSHGVMAYLQRHGYRAIPVNPNAHGETIHGEKCRSALGEIDEPVDMVDIFRRSEFAGAAVDDAIAIGAKVVWTQLGVRDEAAAARAEAVGLKVVMNRCPAIEIPRLGLPRR
jgi:uncharacterized protein